MEKVGVFWQLSLWYWQFEIAKIGTIKELP